MLAATSFFFHSDARQAARGKLGLLRSFDILLEDVRSHPHSAFLMHLSRAEFRGDSLIPPPKKKEEEEGRRCAEKQIQFHFKTLTLNHEAQQLHASGGGKKMFTHYKASHSDPSLGKEADVSPSSKQTWESPASAVQSSDIDLTLAKRNIHSWFGSEGQKMSLFKCGALLGYAIWLRFGWTFTQRLSDI